jgi:hypothetical protein
VNARAKAALVSALIILGALAVWFGVLAIGTPEQGDCPGVKPPEAVPGPPVEAGR